MDSLHERNAKLLANKKSCQECSRRQGVTGFCSFLRWVLGLVNGPDPEIPVGAEVGCVDRESHLRVLPEGRSSF